LSKGSRQRPFDRKRWDSNKFWENKHDERRAVTEDAGPTGVSSPPQTETLVPEVPEDLLQGTGDDPEGTL